jgi:septum formation protein
MSISATHVPHIVLASGSPRRRDLMEALGVKYEVVVSRYREDAELKSYPSRVVMTHAQRKVQDVAQRVTRGVVVGADTIVYHRGRVYGKPRDLAEARNMLRQLQGQTHAVYTGLALYDVARDKLAVDYVRTRVVMRTLDDAQIDRYFQLVNPLDKAGGYAIQEAAGVIVERVDGCYYNVIGFPVAKLDEMLRGFGYALL